jgi:hypothetical protein
MSARPSNDARLSPAIGLVLATENLGTIPGTGTRLNDRA